MESTSHDRLFKKAVALLARRPYSCSNLRNKLAAFSNENDVEAVISKLKALKLLNDYDYAYNFALRRMGRQACSSARVKIMLAEQHIAPEIIEEAVRQVCTETGGDEPALERHLNTQCKSGISADLASVQKLVGRLIRLGFEKQSILEKLKGRIPNEILRYIETGE